MDISEQIRDRFEKYIEDHKNNPIRYDNTKGLVREPTLAELAERYPPKREDISKK